MGSGNRGVFPAPRDVRGTKGREDRGVAHAQLGVPMERGGVKAAMPSVGRGERACDVSSVGVATRRAGEVALRAGRCGGAVGTWCHSGNVRGVPPELGEEFRCAGGRALEQIVRRG